MAANISAEQITHLTEHLDEFTKITGAESVEAYFAEHPEAQYKAFCELFGIEPLEETPEVAAAKAAEAFEAMPPREHRKVAQHLLTCPSDGLLSVLGTMPIPIPSEDLLEGTIVGTLMGKPTGGMVASKVENLQNAKAALTKIRAMLDEAETHLDAAIVKYAADV